MGKRKILLILQAVVCILLTLLLAAGAVVICRDGLARKAQDPTENIYTPENTAAWFAAAVPLFLAFLVLLAAGLALGVRDPKADRPAQVSGPVKPEAGPRHRGFLQAAAVIAAILLIVAGILNGSALDVLIKAIHICTECVGLG